jgi:hypothetical protein
MTGLHRLEHEFVHYIPEKLDDGKLYVSVEFATVAHLCCCGCRSEVVTPLSPTDWQLTFDGESVSLDPSIGNWRFACRSHYWIRRGRVQWARRWSEEEIRAGRAQDLRSKERYFDEAARALAPEPNVEERPQAALSDHRLWRGLKRWWRARSGKGRDVGSE